MKQIENIHNTQQTVKLRQCEWASCVSR